MREKLGLGHEGLGPSGGGEETGSVTCKGSDGRR
jgi:hypothetical protein